MSYPPPNFGWLWPRKLAGSGIITESSLPWIISHGISTIVSLERIDDACRAILEEENLQHLDVRVPDFGAPSIEDLDKVTQFMECEIRRGRIVLVHCAAGKGRTGTVLAAYLMRTGRTFEEAVNEVRRKRPGSIQSYEQEEVLRKYSSLRNHLRRGH